MIYYTVYRTVNTVNGKYYFGVHKTDNPYDGYLGSGKHLKHAIAKYGEDKFLKNICFIFDNPEEAFQMEHDLIEEYRKDPMCYNLREGGSGGFDWINNSGKNGTRFVTQAARQRAVATKRGKAAANPEYLDKVKSAIALATKGWQSKPHEFKLASALRASKHWKGKHHSDKKRATLSSRLRGKNNGQFGTHWMTKNGVNKKVQPEEVDALGLDGWQLGRCL